MKKYILALVPMAFLYATPIEATVITYHAMLSGPNESPSNASPGTGTAIVKYDDILHTLAVDAMFTGLLGTTTASHIHCCTAAPLTGIIGVATTIPTFADFPLGVTSGTYSRVLDLTLASSWNQAFITANGGTPGGAELKLAAGLAGGLSYFNIHTTSFGGGEIRGFLVPEPATIGLIGLGIGTLAFARRKRASAIRSGARSPASCAKHGGRESSWRRARRERERPLFRRM